MCVFVRSWTCSQGRDLFFVDGRRTHGKLQGSFLLRAVGMRDMGAETRLVRFCTCVASQKNKFITLASTLVFELHVHGTRTA